MAGKLHTALTLMVQPMQALCIAPVHWLATQYRPIVIVPHSWAPLKIHRFPVAALPFCHSMTIWKSSNRQMRHDHDANPFRARLKSNPVHSRWNRLCSAFRCVVGVDVPAIRLDDVVLNRVLFHRLAILMSRDFPANCPSVR